MEKLFKKANFRYHWQDRESHSIEVKIFLTNVILIQIKILINQMSQLLVVQKIIQLKVITKIKFKKIKNLKSDYFCNII